MHLIVGLGNPGRDYADTRHNMGFMAIDTLAATLGTEIKKQHFDAMIAEVRAANGEKIILAKPQTYMNESGQSVRKLMNWFKCEHDELLVMYDDIDLPVGDLRIRSGGSAGTHNGMRSIIYQLAYDDFMRIRIGIGKPAPNRDLISHVLGVPTKDEQELLKVSISNAAKAASLIIAGKLNDAQAEFNKKKSTKKQDTDEE